MLFVGDILQLLPVNGQPVFEQIATKSLTHKLGCTTAVNIWRDSVVYDELTLNERQKKDGKFSELLDSVRCDLPTEETLRALQERVVRLHCGKVFRAPAAGSESCLPIPYQKSLR